MFLEEHLYKYTLFYSISDLLQSVYSKNEQILQSINVEKYRYISWSRTVFLYRWCITAYVASHLLHFIFIDVRPRNGLLHIFWLGSENANYVHVHTCIFVPCILYILSYTIIYLPSVWVAQILQFSPDWARWKRGSAKSIKLPVAKEYTKAIYSKRHRKPRYRRLRNFVRCLHLKLHAPPGNQENRPEIGFRLPKRAEKGGKTRNQKRPPVLSKRPMSVYPEIIFFKRSSTSFYSSPDWCDKWSNSDRNDGFSFCGVHESCQNAKGSWQGSQFWDIWQTDSGVTILKPRSNIWHSSNNINWTSLLSLHSRLAESPGPGSFMIKAISAIT